MDIMKKYLSNKLDTLTDTIMINVENIYKRSKILTYLYNHGNFAWQIALIVSVVCLVIAIK
jgi:hypothetical protein